MLVVKDSKYDNLKSLRGMGCVQEIMHIIVAKEENVTIIELALWLSVCVAINS